MGVLVQCARAGTSQAASVRRIRKPPSSKIEKDLAAIWKELLNVDVLDVEEDFFDLGGTSLTAASCLLA
jgi:pyochelin synthetase